MLELLDRDDPPALLLTDVRMPGKDVPMLAREARIVVPDLKVASATELEDFIQKPFSPAELTRSVRALLDRDGEGRS